MTTAARRGLRGHARDAALGVLSTAALYLLAEAFLALAGLGDPWGRTHLSRGFDPRAAYLVPDPEIRGGWRTQFSDGDFPERAVPPKGAARRVVLLGGSNTQAFPEDHLQAILERGAPGAYEVCNLGRNGYGSERVRILAEQALERLEPDVLVVYSGHNEFTELGFQQDLAARWSAPWKRELAALALRTRTVNALVDLLEPRRRPRGALPEARAFEFERFAGMPLERTLAYYDAYEANLERIVRRALRSGVEVVLCPVVFNDFAAPWESGLGPGAPEEVAREADRALAGAARRYPDWMRPLLPRLVHERVQLTDWRGTLRHPAHEALDSELGFRPRGGPLALEPPGLPPPVRWQPVVVRLLRALQQLELGPADAQERVALEDAEERLAAALEEAPGHPDLHFELGLVRHALRRPTADVAGALEAAGRLDRASRRGNHETNARVRRVAARHPEVRLLDAEAFFRAHLPRGLVGWECTTDHCHLNPGMARVLMAELARFLLEG